MTENLKLNRQDYWKNFGIPEEKLFFNASFAKSFILDSQDYDYLKKISKEILYAALQPHSSQEERQKVSFEKVLEEINKTTKLAVKKDLETSHQLENWLVGILEKNNLLTGIEGIEFPVNLRAMHSKAPEGHLKFEYATDYYHTDIWSGEPEDIIIGFIYIEGDITKTFMEVYDVDPKDEEIFAKKLDKYNTLDKNSARGQKIEYTPQKGQMILMDGICPHQTVRLGGGARISLDVRLRRKNPYADLSGWGKSHAPWSRYWFLERNRASSFSKRAEQELALLEKIGQFEGLELRKKWIDQAYIAP